MGLLWAGLDNGHRLVSLPHEHQWESWEEERKALDFYTYTTLREISKKLTRNLLISG